MSHCEDHHPPAGSAVGVGIARSKAFDPVAFESAVTDLLAACGIAPDMAHMGRTAQRVRELWQKRLLGGYDLDPAAALGEGFPDTRTDMVVIRGIAIHGVCPHHLVPFRGVAHVAYIPGGRLHGFGRIARMVDAIGPPIHLPGMDDPRHCRCAGHPWPCRRRRLHHRGGATLPAARRGTARGDERVVTQAFAGRFETSDQLRNEVPESLEITVSLQSQRWPVADARAGHAGISKCESPPTGPAIESGQTSALTGKSKFVPNLFPHFFVLKEFQ
jgi:GTP cyclohydrolase I